MVEIRKCLQPTHYSGTPEQFRPKLTVSKSWSLAQSAGFSWTEHSTFFKSSGKFCNVSCHMVSSSHSAAVIWVSGMSRNSGRAPTGAGFTNMPCSSSLRRVSVRYSRNLKPQTRGNFTTSFPVPLLVSFLAQPAAVVLGPEQFVNPQHHVLPVDVVGEGRGDDLECGAVVQELGVQCVRFCRASVKVLVCNRVAQKRDWLTHTFFHWNFPTSEMHFPF